MNAADLYTLHLTIAEEAMAEAEHCREMGALGQARRWLVTARRNVDAMAALAAAGQALAPFAAKPRWSGGAR